MRKKAYMMGREMIWEQVIQFYAHSFTQARQERMSTINSQVPYAVGAHSTAAFKLPVLRLDHLFRLTDSTGIVQHAGTTCRITKKAIAPTITHGH
ncbi:hypothetical protein [Spirosoma telluris]|uniref:hypothetical protein n=1 Tax=Spirosoma telluris TaxID=2183553 RepID=UPI002FC30C87